MEWSGARYSCANDTSRSYSRSSVLCRPWSSSLSVIEAAAGSSPDNDKLGCLLPGCAYIVVHGESEKTSGGTRPT